MILSNLGSVVGARGEGMLAATLYEESLERFRALGDQRHMAMVLNNLGERSTMLGDYAQAQRLYEEGLAISRALEDKGLIAPCLRGLGVIAEATGEDARALELYEESIELFHAFGDTSSQAVTLGRLSVVVQRRGEDERARALSAESLSLARGVQNLGALAEVLTAAGHLARAMGDLARAAAHYRESLELYQRLSTTVGAAVCLEGLAIVLLACDYPADAVRLWGAAAALRRTHSTPSPPHEADEQQRQLTMARGVVGVSAFDTLWMAGSALAAAQALAEGIAASQLEHERGMRVSTTGALASPRRDLHRGAISTAPLLWSAVRWESARARGTRWTRVAG
jgi:tetratricopeptide (TPR) repeat protein